MATDQEDEGQVTPSEGALHAILRDIAAAVAYHARGKGGQHAGGPPRLWQVSYSALMHLERTCCFGLGVSHTDEAVARLLADEARTK